MLNLVKIGYDEKIVNIIYKYGSDILESESFQREKDFIQHGTTSTYAHSLCVAYMSVWLAVRKKNKVDMRSVVRGALLHDYFLYDWHDKDVRPEGLHGYRHPAAALKNASSDYELTAREKDIIRSHMWPLTLTKIPHCREAWIVSAADKYCSLLETLKLRHGAAAQYIENKKRQRKSAEADS